MLIKSKKIKIDDPAKVVNILSDILSAENELDRDKEHFWVVGLKTNGMIKYIELVFLGSLNESVAHPREIFRTAIYYSVNSIIIAHNHPSEEINPSSADNIVTRRIVEAGKLLDILVLDHVIVGNETGDYFSYKEKGLLF